MYNGNNYVNVHIYTSDNIIIETEKWHKKVCEWYKVKHNIIIVRGYYTHSPIELLTLVFFQDLDELVIYTMKESPSLM